MTRSTIRAFARCLACVLVLAQLFVAAYACPRLAATPDVMAADAAVMGVVDATGDVGGAAASVPMAGCTGMAAALDQDAANLCAEHCKAGHQSADVPTPSISAPLLTSVYVLLPAPVPVPPSRPGARTLDALVSASPPLAVLHCVYRL